MKFKQNSLKIFLESLESWTAFPIMNSLKELDLRNCSLSYLEYNVFDSLRNIEKLFLSHNLLSVISARTFAPMYFLNHLDLSFNRMIEVSPYMYDPFSVFLSGLLIEEEVFHQLPNLIFLDLSHSKLKQESVKALTRFREKIEQLSLCYTEIPLIAPFMFMFTNLKVLDLSGNPNLNTGLVSTWFGGLETKLEILIFKNSNIKNLAPLKNLKKLRMLDLGMFNFFKCQENRQN
jgi:Leucine-rich repeat (LRR) protein